MHLRRSFTRLAVLAAAIAIPSASPAQVVITVAPPALPVYVQPAIPAPGYIWTPGYWAYADGDYYWVPGTWVEPPRVGLLWTPGYWGWREGVYVWNVGYWGPRVGYYGGINYGHGYAGTGYLGGEWRGGVFAYNKTVNNFGSVKVVNTYNKTVIQTTNVTQVSYNGGAGGTTVKPTADQAAFAKEQHVAPTAAQTLQQHTASTNKALFHSVNNGNPGVAATSHAGQFTGTGVVGARGVTGTGGGAATGTGAPGGANTLSKTGTGPATGPAGTGTPGTANTVSKTGTLPKTDTLSTKPNTLPKTNTLSTNTGTPNTGTPKTDTLSTKTNTLPKTNTLSTNALPKDATPKGNPRVNAGGVPKAKGTAAQAKRGGEHK